MENSGFLRICIIFFLLLLSLLISSLFIGSVSLSLSALFTSDSSDSVIFFSIRLPRTAAAFLAGIAFAVSGYLIQSATANDLASPNIIGINSGAGFSVLFFLSFFPGLYYLLPFVAFIGAIISVICVFMISSFTSRVSSSSSLILAGVAVNALFNALISVLSSLNPDVMSSYSSFSIGGFSSVYASSLYVPAVLIIASTLLSFLFSPVIDVIRLGDEITSSMGYRPHVIRIILIGLSALMAASAVSFAGLLGFVGLVTPHIASFLTAGNGRRTFILSLLLGPSLVLLSDILARIVIMPSELPAGIFMAVLGVPFFVFLLISKRGAR